MLDIHITDMLLCFQLINENITMPFPIGYSQLCKVLMLIFVLGCPYIIETDLGLFANVFFPGVIGIALFGIENVATDLELPFGEDANDLNVSECAHVFECECVELLRACGKLGELAADRFQFTTFPEQYD